MFDNFSKEKADFLKKKDKSKKGFIDNAIKEIIKEINSKSDCYTTSSCAGRIVLLEMKSNKKNECNWIFMKHNKVTINEIINSLKRYQNKKIKNQVWFKQQPLILHVACRDVESAKKLLDASRKVFKHSGILSITGRKVIVEIIGNERIETIVADKYFAANDKYIKELVKYANDNFVENKNKSKKFLVLIKKL